MRRKVGFQIWWTLASLVMIAAAVVAPTISPMTPPTEKECKDNVNPDVCTRVGYVRTSCCLSKMLFDCQKVEMWKHNTDGTYHFRNPTDCDNEGIACVPYNNHCD